MIDFLLGLFVCLSVCLVVCLSVSPSFPLVIFWLAILDADKRVGNIGIAGSLEHKHIFKVVGPYKA